MSTPATGHPGGHTPASGHPGGSAPATGHPGGHTPAANHPGGKPDLDRAPITVAWELTRACALRCRHCRASAITRRDPAELDTDEGKGLISDIAAAGARVLVLTGGDPLARPDLEELVAWGRAEGLHVGLSPAVTGRLRYARLADLAEAGVASVHLSLDGASAATHDGLRGVRGSFERTLTALDWVGELGLRLQIGTSVTTGTVEDLPALATLLTDHPVTMWNLFFLVPTGRGEDLATLDAAEHEAVLTWLAEASEDLPFGVRTTAAPTYRRIRHDLGLPPPPAGSANDGRGFCFVSHTGEVHPSGFLPVPVGHVREAPLGEIYREAPLMRALRDPAALKGACGRCDWNRICGGSRARAYALTGDPLASDPTCVRVPALTG